MYHRCLRNSAYILQCGPRGLHNLLCLLGSQTLHTAWPPLKLAVCRWTVDRVGAQLPGRTGPRRPSDAQLSVETSMLALATHLKWQSQREKELWSLKHCWGENCLSLRSSHWVLCTDEKCLDYHRVWLVPRASIILANPSLLWS